MNAPLPGHVPGDRIATILNRIVVDDRGCWNYTGTINPDGYGTFGRFTTHRLMWEHENGPIDKGLHADHLCRNKACCNPQHLEPVPPGVNIGRGLLPELNRARAAARTHCRNGHEFTNENTYRRPDNARDCRTCRREAGRLRRDRKKESGND